MFQGKALITNQISILLLLLLIVGAGLYSQNNALIAANNMGLGKDVVADILPPPLYLIEAQLVVYDLLQADSAARQPLLDKLASLKKDYDTRNEYWELSELDPAIKAILLGEQRKHADLFWAEVQNQFIPAIRSNNVDGMSQSALRIRRHYEAHREGVNTTVTASVQYAENSLNALSASAKHGYWMQGLTAGMGLLLTLGLSIPLIKRFYRNLNHVQEITAAIAAGNLTCNIPAASNDETGKVLAQLAIMRSKLHSTIQQLSGASIQLAAAAEETSSVTNQTSASLLQQQSETEQVATAMNEMNATVREVARNANDAATAAHKADDAAQTGKQVVTQTINTIDTLAREVETAVGVIRQLEQESNGIGKVLDVIRSIAEQTNLLALNAAIEAARAGEHGRGFAVVADEVRTLASRTQKSTAEIQSMIQKLQTGAANAVKIMETNSTQAQAGVKQVAQAGTSLDSISRAVATINDMNAQIAAAAEEQTAVAEEINRNIVNISQSTEQSSQGAQQTATASEELAQLAGQLHGLVGQFKI